MTDPVPQHFAFGIYLLLECVLNSQRNYMHTALCMQRIFTRCKIILANMNFKCIPTPLSLYMSVARSNNRTPLWFTVVYYEVVNPITIRIGRKLRRYMRNHICKLNLDMPTG